MDRQQHGWVKRLSDLYAKWMWLLLFQTPRGLGCDKSMIFLLSKINFFWDLFVTPNEHLWLWVIYLFLMAQSTVFALPANILVQLIAFNSIFEFEIWAECWQKMVIGSGNYFIAGSVCDKSSKFGMSGWFVVCFSAALLRSLSRSLSVWQTSVLKWP